MLLPNENEAIMEEIWLPLSPIFIPGLSPIYSISTYGRIYNNLTKNFLPQDMMYNKDKYITVCLKGIDNSNIFQMPHRLMMIVFNYRPDYELFDVNHKDGVKYHNWLWNLEWITKSGNIQHAIKNNLFNLGETRQNSKLTNDQVRMICKLIVEGKRNYEIAEMVGVENCNVSKIVTNIKLGKSWRHISKDYF